MPHFFPSAAQAPLFRQDSYKTLELQRRNENVRLIQCQCYGYSLSVLYPNKVHLSILNATGKSPSHNVPGSSAKGNAIAQKALTKLGARYWWGAPGGGFGDGQGLDNPNAKYFDCSGFVAWAHRQSGVKI